ncbi:MAG: class IV adenylate cyclase [Gemmatimonadaceae bacterium]|nr:class IV adenylate cyclase [Gemmatimonadaceae bacterium]MDQ3243059.1 class IV adenylate cyclase [Gemmatimonadota bacterium]
MREVELKSVVDDPALRRSLLERGGGRLVFAGQLTDYRYDHRDVDLAGRDHVLRLRVYDSDKGREGHIDWKGETRYEGGYKVREEISTGVSDPDAIAVILKKLGFAVIQPIEREIAQYELDGAIVRFEQYPKMDVLVEVEGSPDAIERAITVMGLPRSGFTTGRLADFVARYEARSGQTAALTRADLPADSSKG